MITTASNSIPTDAIDPMAHLVYLTSGSVARPLSSHRSVEPYAF
jgi:hypothetical protein